MRSTEAPDLRILQELTNAYEKIMEQRRGDEKGFKVCGMRWVEAENSECHVMPRSKNTTMHHGFVAYRNIFISAVSEPVPAALLEFEIRPQDRRFSDSDTEDMGMPGNWQMVELQKNTSH